MPSWSSLQITVQTTWYSPGSGRRGELEFLPARLKQQAPSLHRGSILCSQQGEAMDGPIAIPRFAPARGHAQEQLLTGFDSDLRGSRLFLGWALTIPEAPRLKA
jgi:hypothetical protein